MMEPLVPTVADRPFGPFHLHKTTPFGMVLQMEQVLMGRVFLHRKIPSKQVLGRAL